MKVLASAIFAIIRVVSFLYGLYGSANKIRVATDDGQMCLEKKWLNNDVVNESSSASFVKHSHNSLGRKKVILF